MKSYCLKWGKNAECVHLEISETSNGKTMILSKCKLCGPKKSRFIKNQQAKGLLSNLGLETPLNKIPLIGLLLF